MLLKVIQTISENESRFGKISYCALCWKILFILKSVSPQLAFVKVVCKKGRKEKL